MVIWHFICLFSIKTHSARERERDSFYIFIRIRATRPTYPEICTHTFPFSAANAAAAGPSGLFSASLGARYFRDIDEREREDVIQFRWTPAVSSSPLDIQMGMSKRNDGALSPSSSPATLKGEHVPTPIDAALSVERHLQIKIKMCCNEESFFERTWLNPPTFYTHNSLPPHSLHAHLPVKSNV